jgi:hypothetical protein
MWVREMSADDIPAVREIWEKQAYGFDFPDFEKLVGCHVCVEDGKVIGFAGAELQAEVIGMVDPDWGSPHQKMGMFAALHEPLAAALDVEKAYICVQKKSFGRHLKKLGWLKAPWELYVRKVR